MMPTMSRVESFLPPFETSGSGVDEIGLEVGAVGNAHTDASGRPHKPGLPMYEAAGNLDSVVGTAPDKLLLATLNTVKLTIFNGGMLPENELLRRFSSESEVSRSMDSGMVPFNLKIENHNHRSCVNNNLEQWTLKEYQ